MLFRSTFIAVLSWPLFLNAATPDPAHAEAEVPSLIYQSAFASYQSMRDEDRTPDQVWRDANDTVSRIGGHAGYVRQPDEAARPKAPASAQPHHAH